MPRFSLVVATFNRTDELSVLIQSLARQEMRDFEVIVVDQNSDDRLRPMLSGWISAIEERDGSGVPLHVKHIHSSPGASKARNLGIEHSSGDILAFPDDDCWYHPDTLKNIDAWFRQHDDYGILSIGCRDERGRVSSNRWWQKECDLKWVNIFRTSGTCTFFVRRPRKAVPLLFDESLGPGAGTQFGCGEDTDFLLTLMRYGIRGRFKSSIHIGHPRRDGFVDVRRAESYGGGFGGVLAKHSNPFLYVGLVAFDFARATLSLLAGDREKAARLWAHGAGIIRAYSSWRPL